MGDSGRHAEGKEPFVKSVEKLLFGVDGLFLWIFVFGNHRISDCAAMQRKTNPR